MKTFSFWKPSRRRPESRRLRSRLDIEPLEKRSLLSTLVAAYNFNEASGTVLHDYSGNGNNGVISDATWSPSGKFGGALSFTGNTNSYVKIPAAPSLNLTSGMTVETWLDPLSLKSHGQGWSAAISKEHVNSSNDVSYALYAANGTGTPAGAHILVGGTDYGAQGGSPLRLNTWTFLAATYDGSSLRMYVNGNLVATRSVKGTIAATTDSLKIGGDWSGEMFAGLIDNVRVYNSALTQAQIKTDMSTPVSNSRSSLTVNPATLPSATVNSAFSAAVSATGGSGTYTFAVTSGSLPSWLSLNTSTGGLSGTPTTIGTSSFTITAADSKTAGLTGSRTFTLTVNPGSSLTVSSATLPSGTVNKSYSTTVSVTGGSGSYTFAVTSGSLPSGLSVNSTTGVLSGTPTSAGTSTVTITAADSKTAGLTGSRTYTLVVNPASSTQTFPNNANIPPLPAPTGTVINVATVGQLQAAVTNLQSGQTIMIAPGTYNLTDTLYVPQGRTNISIRGATGNAADVIIKGDAVFDTSAPYTGSAIWGAGSGITGTIPFGIWLGNVQGATIADLTLEDYVYHAIILNAGVQSPLIHDVVMMDVGEQLLKVNPNPAGGGVNNGIVEYCTIGFTTAAPNSYTNGVDMLTAQNWIIRNNLFKNILTTNSRALTGNSSALTGPAVLVWGGSSNVQTINNTFINCQTEIAYGLVSGATFDNTGGLIANNFIYRSGSQRGDVGISVRNSPNTEVAYNTIILNGDYVNAIEYRFTTTTGVTILYNLTDAAITQRDGATAAVTGNVTTAQPSWFVNESSGNLDLTSAATGAIDHGVYLAEVPMDYNGRPRPSIGPTDVGADQF